LEHHEKIEKEKNTGEDDPKKDLALMVTSY
jgi:hypothetical protein